MAERIEGATEPKRRRWYPWTEWTDGSVWRAKEGEDFTCSPSSFQTALHIRARQEGLEVATGSPEPGIVEFQFTKKVEADGHLSGCSRDEHCPGEGRCR